MTLAKLDTCANVFCCFIIFQVTKHDGDMVNNNNNKDNNSVDMNNMPHKK